MRTVLATALTLTLAACGTAPEEPAAPATPPSAAEPSSPGPSTTPAEAQSGQGAGLDAITTGDRRILIHLAGADRDLSATYEGPIALGDGTDDGALFRLLPVAGGQFMIEALRPREEGGRWCVIVDDRALGTELCAEHDKSRFALVPDNGVDDKNRPTHHVINDAVGAVQYDGELYVAQTGTPAAFSLVDRGAA